MLSLMVDSPEAAVKRPRTADFTEGKLDLVPSHLAAMTEVPVFGGAHLLSPRASGGISD